MAKRLVDPKVRLKDKTGANELIRELPLQVNQVEEVIKMYKEKGHGTNQATMEIGMPSDIALADPPCLRIIDTRIRYGKLHFICIFAHGTSGADFPRTSGAWSW